VTTMKFARCTKHELLVASILTVTLTMSFRTLSSRGHPTGKYASSCITSLLARWHLRLQLILVPRQAPRDDVGVEVVAVDLGRGRMRPRHDSLATRRVDGNMTEPRKRIDDRRRVGRSFCGIQKPTENSWRLLAQFDAQQEWL
jgi:hypothetical protein